MTSAPTKTFIVDLIKKGDRSVSSIVSDAIIPSSLSIEEISNLLFTIPEIREQLGDPLAKVRAYLLCILLIFEISETNGITEDLNEQDFSQVLLYSRLSLPICASISDVKVTEFFDEIKNFLENKYEPTFIKLQKALGLIDSPENIVTEQKEPTKRKHYADPLKTDPKKTEKQDSSKFDYGAFKHAVSYRPGASLNNMVKIRVKKNHGSSDNKVRAKL
ncbi:hypothetical protein TVAG_005770 [Trichomonas vaginalis G3]|uniref:Uncharacterized protein n=1 Tax=Trichomonas vaginalis (strain ATCC PRA-98 / G3) TaxID=412133 RepID=A2FHR2_TRIV3|nr:hypothetical protein TVAGG3_0554320 [Trichomonas vaginalis G3]EAX95562.1 hypothetical protein TVAG_005770 [Trichomonas vaginalis G3]KAI5520754.1 hypothetical protein TVAGG3_0554320 [Trichomonas vaginalis G3]|eukprot:XP_001308492.1 hypothetical protein [Trichomonas vaginalis G3]